jgi:DNA primase
VKKFSLGFSPNRELALKKYLVDKKKVDSGFLQKSGIVYFKDGFPIDRFRGRIIFPLFDHRGNICGFAGRILPIDEKRDLAKYINTPETLVYHKSQILFGLNETKADIKKLGFAIIVEGELDMISSWQAGVKNCIAIKGSALTEEQLRLLTRFTSKITLALDSDFAGNAAARRGVVLAESRGFEVKVALLEDYKDPDDMARKDPDGYKKAIGGAVGIWDFLINMVFKKYESGSKQGLSREIVPVLSLIEDKIVQAHYSHQVSEKLGIPLEAVLTEVEKFLVKDKKSYADETKQDSDVFKKGRRQLLEERALAIIFKEDNSVLEDPEFLKIFKNSLLGKIVDKYKDYAKLNKGRVSLKAFYDILPAELASGFQSLILADNDILGEEGKSARQELLMIKSELEEMDVRGDLETLAVKIRSLEKDKKKEELEEAKREFNRLSSLISQRK